MKYHSRSSVKSSSKSSAISSSTESLQPKFKKHDKRLYDLDAKISNYCYRSTCYDSEDTDNDNKVFEEMLSGNSPSNNHDDFFDMQSVRTDYLNEENLLTSTPMNCSFQDDCVIDQQDEFDTKALHPVDLKMYNVRKFKMSLGQVRNWYLWYGHIESTSNPVNYFFLCLIFLLF